eukprot:284606-Hanusia_phi.AAC.5
MAGRSREFSACRNVSMDLMASVVKLASCRQMRQRQSGGTSPFTRCSRLRQRRWKAAEQVLHPTSTLLYPHTSQCNMSLPPG